MAKMFQLQSYIFYHIIMQAASWKMKMNFKKLVPKIVRLHLSSLMSIFQIFHSLI